MVEQITTDVFGQLEPRYIGPVGNRVSALAGVPGDHLVYYAGAAAGGIFKTTDGGTHWKPVFDGQAQALEGKPLPAKVSSIGALAVSESNPGVVWAGTGESWIRGPISIGNGIYKSVDGGATWTHMGLEKSGRFGKIVIHPTNPDIVWAAAVGSCYGPSDCRGVFMTTDGGLSWKRTLHAKKDAKQETGCSDIVIDPNNPEILYAGLWQFKLRSWVRVSGGPGGGLHKSVDGGESWTELTNGLPTGERAPDGKPYQVGKISVGVARSDSNYVYANIETGDGAPTWDFPCPGNGQLWQSTDAGESWTTKSYNRSINSRAAYYTRNAVSPDNKHEVYFFGPKLAVTIDGGETIKTISYPEAPGVDHHEAWIDPTNGDRIAVASDLGISISQNRGKTWYKINLPISQMYQVSVDDEIPYNVFGNCQDRIATWGPSNARIPYSEAEGGSATGPIPRGVWTSGGAGECGYSIPDPKDPDLIWSTGAGDGPNGGSVALINRRTGHWRVVTVRPDFTTGAAPKDVEYRFHWHLPLAISPHDDPDDPDRPRRVYAGSQYVHATEDLGQSWHLISPELTGRDVRFLQSSGGLTGDNLNVRMAYALSAIAEAPSEPDLLWAGTSDQRVWLGRKPEGEGEWAWQELSANIEGLPAGTPGAWALVSCIAPSRHRRGTAYVTFDRHQADDPAPYVFKTTDYGKTWTKITAGIPESVVSYVHWLAEDAVCPGLLFAGTENALYVSFDDGGRWQVLPGLPPAPVSAMVVQQHFDDLVISTFGRGFWIFDDITPLRQLAAVADQDAYLFEMTRPIYRFRTVAQANSIPHDNDPTIGIDPQSPAPINFYLKSAAKNVKITILDETQQTPQQVRQVCIPEAVRGINRCWWDLKSDSSVTIKLRTNPENQKGTLYCPSGIRPYSDPVVGTSLSWLVTPGSYTVQLEVDGKTIPQTREIVVLTDPTSLGSLADIELQYKLSKLIWDDLNTVDCDVNVIEFICFQIQQLKEWIENKAALELIDRLDRELRAIEDCLIQRNITGQGEDLARFPGQLVSNLVYLGGIVDPGTGDYRPTDSQREQYEKLHADVILQCDKLKQMLARIEQDINPELQKYNVPILLIKPPDSPICELFGPMAAF